MAFTHVAGDNVQFAVCHAFVANVGEISNSSIIFTGGFEVFPIRYKK